MTPEMENDQRDKAWFARGEKDIFEEGIGMDKQMSQEEINALKRGGKLERELAADRTLKVEPKTEARKQPPKRTTAGEERQQLAA